MTTFKVFFMIIYEIMIIYKIVLVFLQGFVGKKKW